MIELLLLFLVLIGFIPLYWRLVGLNLSATSLFFGAIWLVYGAGYMVFSRLYGPSILHSLIRPADEQLPQLQICTRVLGQYKFVLQTSINQGTISTLDLALCTMFTGLIAGCMIADKFYGNTRTKLRQAEDEWECQRSTPFISQHNTTLMLISTISLSFLAYFAIQDEQIAKLIEYFSSQSGEFEKIKMRQSFGGSDSYLYNLLLASALPFICIYLLVLEKKHHRVLLLLATTCIALLLIGKLSLLSKAPFVIFITQILLAVTLKQSIKYRRTLIWTGVIAIEALLLMIYTANSDVSPLDGAGFVLYRVFMAPNEALLEYFASIPHFIPQTFGLDNRFLAYLLNVPPLEATHDRISEFYRGVKGYTSNAMFIADAWAQFSWAGIAGASLLSGFLFRCIDTELIVKMGRSAASIAGLVLAYFSVFTALTTALQTSLLTGGLLIILPMAWFFRQFEKRSLDAQITISPKHSTQ